MARAAVVSFEGDPDRRIAGLPWAARIARELAEAGYERAVLTWPSDFDLHHRCCYAGTLSGGEVARLFLALLIALALLPASNGAAAVPARDCAMAQEGMAQDGMAMPPASHDESCCTDACVMAPCAVALPSSGGESTPPDLVGTIHWVAPSAVLQSSNPAADDPPPRL